MNAIKCLLTSLLVIGVVFNTAQADWLTSQSQPDGSIATINDLATATQATSEAILTLRMLGRANEVALAEAYVAAETHRGTEYLARQITTKADVGIIDPAMIVELQSHQNADGGFGELAGYTSNAIDTAFAIQALSAANYATSSSAAYGVGYLLSSQRGDGGWADPSGTSDLYTTAVLVRTLHSYRERFTATSAAIANASNFLLSKRQTDASWGEPLLTAQALLALSSTTSDVSTLSSTATALRQSRDTNGSWASDVYSTALALRALFVFDARSGGAVPTATSGSVAGYVLRVGSSEPLANAIVKLASVSGVTVQTNSLGYFVLNGVPAGEHTVLASKSGFGMASRVATVRAAQINTIGDLYLSQDAELALVKGTVFDSANNLTISGVAITLTGPSTITLSSDSNGRFDAGAIAAGHYSITFNKSGYYDLSGQLDAVSGGVTQIQQGLLQQGAYLDTSAAQLIGQVIDASTDRPIPTALVSLGSAAAIETSSDGAFTLDSVARGAYQLHISAAGYSTAAYSFVFAPGASGDLGTLKLFPAVNSSAPTTLTVVGTLIDAIDNHVLAGASVTVADTDQVINTDAAGKFTITNLPSLTFTLTASMANYDSRTFSGTASAYGEVAGTFALPPSGGSSTATSSAFHGTVRNGITNEVIAGARVNIPGTALTATTGSDGSYQLANVTNLSFSLSASSAAYLHRSYSIELIQHGTYAIDIALTPDPNAGATGFQVLSFNAVETGTGANTQQLFAARIANLREEPRQVQVMVNVVDATNVVVATVSPFAVDTQTPAVQFSFNHNGIIELMVPWNPEQLPPGSYRMVLHVTESGSITQALPTGIVLAQAETNASVSTTQKIAGEASFDPPLTQAGATTPVALSALVINSGNVPLVGASFTLTVTDPATSQVIHSAQATAPILEVGNNLLLSFGTWTTAKTGNLPINIRADDSTTIGTIASTLYVGDKANGIFTVNKAVVPVGTQLIRASVALSGVDVRTGISTDPLFFAVKEALRKGGEFVGAEAKQWNETGRCLGCHIQTQSFMGMATAMDKATIDKSAVQYLYNDLVGALQSGGQIFASHGDHHPQTQTTLGLWSLSNWQNTQQIFRTLYRAASYQLTKMRTSGDRSWWTYDHCGVWYCNIEGQTMTTVKGMSAVIKMSEELGANTVNDYVYDDTGIDTGIRDLMGMQQGPDGWLWYTDSAGGLYARDMATTTSRVIATNLGSPSSPVVGLAVKADGTAYVASRSGLFKVAPNGTKTAILGTSGFRWDAALGPDGAVYVADNKQILKITADDQVSVFVSGGLLDVVTGLSFDIDGTLYASNSNSYNILKITPAGVVSVFADGLPFQPTWLRRGKDGYLYASTQRYSDMGTVAPGIFRIDSQGYVERLPIFNAPNIHGQNAIGVIDGDIYVHNAANRRMYRQRIILQETSKIANMRIALVSAARYTLATYNDNAQANDIHAMRLITLGEARPFITDATLLGQVNIAIANIATLLRNRQRADGGWANTTSRTVSDPYTTAFAGLAIDYTNPSVNDPLVRKAITYLLNSQAADKSWPYQNGVFTSKLGPTSFVMAYLPLALERLGGIDTDLNITIPANVQLSNPNLAPTSHMANSNGSVSYKWSLQGVTAKTRSIDFDLTLIDMTFNEDRAVATSAYLEFANSFSVEKLKSNISIPSVRASRDLVLDVTTDRPSYPAQTDVAINSKVTNVGPAISGASVHLIVRASDGVTVADLGAVSVGALATNASVDIASSWNTISYLAGGYQVFGQLLSATGTVVYEDIASFQIVTGTAVVGAVITPDKPIYQAWDAVTLTSRIRNLATNAMHPNSIAEVTVRTPDGSVLFFDTYKVGELAPSALHDVLSPVTLIDAPTGVYPINLVVKDAFTRAVVVTAVSSFRVQRDDMQALSGNVKVANTSIIQGDANLCTDTVTNISSTAASGVVLTRKLISFDGGAEIKSENQSADFAAKETRVLFRSIATASLPLGSYVCVLSATYSGSTKQLGSAGFDIVAAPVRVNASMSLGKHGRVLVLVDAPASPTDAVDPFGPTIAPDLRLQREHIESVLTAHHWSYTIVDNAANFEREFKTGGYEIVVVFAEVVKIPEALQDQVVAAVSKGMGLIVAGNHDNRNGRLYLALGIKSTGKNLDALAVKMSTSEVMAAEEENLPVITPPNAINLDGAMKIAEYQLKNPRPDQTVEAAVTLYRYGQGKGVYAGFDLPLEGAAAGDDSLFGRLFAKSLDFVHPTTLTPYGKHVVPVELTLTNFGIATAGRVIVALPAGATAVDAGTGSVQTNGMVVWNFSLAQNQSIKLPFWIRLPDVIGNVLVLAHVQVGAPGAYQDHSDSAFTIRVEVQP